MKIELFQVDAFTNQVFRGNPAAVCPLEHWLDDSLLQAIALENNLSETAFIVPEGNDYHIRWFTPTVEVDLCGHATLASGYVLLNYLRPECEQVSFHSASGVLSVAKHAGRYALNFPSRPGKAIESPEELRQALGVPIVASYLARDWLVVLESEEAVAQLAPNFEQLAKLDCLGVLVTAEGSTCDFVSRCFFPKAGILEDPVTGSAHCTLVPYWAERLGKSSLYCKQISARMGELWCALNKDRVEIAGECVLFLRGEIEV